MSEIVGFRKKGRTRDRKVGRLSGPTPYSRQKRTISIHGALKPLAEVTASLTE